MTPEIEMLERAVVALGDLAPNLHRSGFQGSNQWLLQKSSLGPILDHVGSVLNPKKTPVQTGTQWRQN